MKQFLKSALIVVGAGTASILIYTAYTVYTALESFCGNDGVQTFPNPDHSLNAMLFERNCGALSGFNLQVSVLPSDERLPNDGSNAFVSILGDDPQDDLSVKVHWLDNKTLEIRYSQTARINKKETLVDGVTIRYQAVPVP